MGNWQLGKITSGRWTLYALFVCQALIRRRWRIYLTSVVRPFVGETGEIAMGIRAEWVNLLKWLNLNEMNLVSC